MDKLNLFINKFKKQIQKLINKLITKNNQVLNSLNLINYLKISKKKQIKKMKL